MPKSVNFYGPMQKALGGRIQRDYANDPRRIIAEQLMQQGASTAPVQSPLEGLTRALSAGVGGYFGNQARQAARGREDRLATDMQKVLAGGSAQPWVNPDTGQQEGTAGGYEGMAAALGNINNPDMADFARQITMGQMQERKAAQDAQIARAQGREDYEWKKGIDQQYAKAPAVKTIKTAEGVFVLNPDGTLGNRLGGAKAETEINIGGELKKGFRATPTGAEYIPGGSEDPATIQGKKEAERKAALNIKNLEKLPARRSQIFAATQNAPAFEGAIADAKQFAKSSTTSGLAQQVLGGIAGTDAFSLERALDTIKSNIGFGELLRIKEAGGTLGALSEMENRLLQAMQGALDPRLQGDKLVSALDRVETIHKLNLEQKKREFKEMYPDEDRPWERQGSVEGRPEDVPQELWDEMTDTERAAWQ